MDEQSIYDRLMGFVREEAVKAGCELVTMTRKGNTALYFEIVLDKEGGITLDECGAFNKKVRSLLEGRGINNNEVTLEVCSPGLDRILKHQDELLWAIGKQVKVKVHQQIEGQSVIAGKLLEADEDNGISIEDESGQKVVIRKDNVAKARLNLALKR